VQWASERQRSECALNELWVSCKCGESDTTSGCGSNPTVGDAFDKLYAMGCTLVFGETTELTGGEMIVAARCRDEKVRADFMRVFDRYQDVIERHKTTDLSDSQPTKGNIAGGLTTIEEKALGTFKDRKEMHRRRCARQGRNATPSGSVVHGQFVGRGRDGHVMCGGGFCRSLLSDGSRQRYRNPILR